MTASALARPGRHRATFHVAELARRAGVTPATVRYYARIGLLSPAREAENGYRRFSSDDLRRVMFVRKAQALGLTIGDVRLILDEAAHDTPPCHLVLTLVQERLDEVRERLRELQDAERRMASALAEWASDEQSDDGNICPLIEGVALDETDPQIGRLHAVGGCHGRPQETRAPARP